MQWSSPPRGDFPSSFEWNGVELELLTFAQLEQQSRLNLKNRVTTLREIISAEQPGTRLPPLNGFGPDMTSEHARSSNPSHVTPTYRLTDERPAHPQSLGS